jgi:hypothetical protein
VDEPKHVLDRDWGRRRQARGWAFWYTCFSRSTLVWV